MTSKKHSKSISLQHQAKSIIPGLTQLLSKRPDMFSTDVWPGYFSKAKGAKVWDLDGKEYLDMSISGIGANILGYAVDEVDNEVIANIRNGVSSSLNCPEDVALADKLLELHSWAEEVRYTRCGGEAMAVAIRIARAATGKDKIAFSGYHGWHDWYLSANVTSDSNLNDHLIPGLSPNGVPKALAGTALPFAFNDIDALEELVQKHGSELGAIVMEPMRNFRASSEYWQQVEAIAKRLNIPLIIDEISMGFRINCGGSHLALGINPDIAVFSKALANGFAMAAIIGKSKWMDAAQVSFISSTMWTERVGPTAALATINYYQNNKVHEHLAYIGKQIKQGWQQLADKHGLKIHISGIDALCHFNLEYDNFLTLKSFFIEQMLKQGVLATNMFYCMYAHKDEHVAQYLSAVDNAFASLANALEQPNVMAHIIPSTSGFKRLN
ncbi:aminotransferase class III-fold pyridoxal phosphate-dependent enzyme [Pseudoalteromonas sp. JBTF-M23]|uniref:Aminotransferase class III-fold pyridoxal phosphate-dependent enzyme n=1 Tax=Pseudoalteromonas caenipelagi TaxID=2726988 RepID=A0A849VGE3_9GAMM|nr:aminotransferase class III-fold pyridoxal phosphate-dependent enzyme [Pseudoalteromonas caenipelagi]NOU50781.1 aminotransferase class III-fold pyridoxal phosphate-dependent enzyme [Pseudoalteromonas caenipelagi]